MAQVHSIGAASSIHRPVVNSEDYRVALPQWDYLHTRLHARPLLGQVKLAAGKVLIWLGQQDRDLERKGELVVKILVKAVPRPIPKKKRRRTKLPGCMAEF